jgi:hypothetical protein
MAKTSGAQTGVGLCPFSWIQVTKPAGCIASLFGSSHVTVSEPQPCMLGRCQLWDASASKCGLLTKR